MSQHPDLLEILLSGIDSARPAALFPSLVNQPDKEFHSWLTSQQRFLLCLGKASIDSAKAILKEISCDSLFVLAPYEDPEHSIPVHIGSHPIPNEQSFESTKQLTGWLKEKPAGGSLLVVLSGGTSALCVMPLPSVSLKSKMHINELLIRSGASIQEINTVRKHLSMVKGGQLAGFADHLKIFVQVISDVIGDDLATIASGPFYPDPTTFLEGYRVLENYKLWDAAPEDVRDAFKKGMSGTIRETPKPGTFDIPHRIIASNQIARNTAASIAEKLGYKMQSVEPVLRGDVEDAARTIHNAMLQAPPKSALIWGGEVTVRLTGNGVGGRNQHLALLLTEKLRNQNGSFAAAGTDGIDGNSPAAGAWTDGETYSRGGNLFESAKSNFDSYHYFEALEQNIRTGPTGTNVMDLYVALT